MDSPTDPSDPTTRAANDPATTDPATGAGPGAGRAAAPAMDTATLEQVVPLAGLFGIELQQAGPAGVEGTMAWAPERTTGGGVLHGGALMALADTLGAVCAFLNLPEGAGTSTIESKTNFFRAVRDGVVRGTARPIHVGRSTIGVQTEVRDAEDRLVSLTFQTQAVLT